MGYNTFRKFNQGLLLFGLKRKGVPARPANKQTNKKLSVVDNMKQQELSCKAGETETETFLSVSSKAKQIHFDSVIPLLCIHFPYVHTDV